MSGEPRAPPGSSSSIVRLHGLTVEPLAHQDVRMASRVAGHLADHLEAVPPVEARRTEAVGVEGDLRTATAPRLALDDAEQPAADAMAPVRLAHPEVLDPARPAPRPTVDAGDEPAPLVAHRREQLAPVVDADRRHVEGVDLLAQLGGHCAIRPVEHVYLCRWLSHVRCPVLRARAPLRRGGAATTRGDPRSLPRIWQPCDTAGRHKRDPDRRPSRTPPYTGTPRPPAAPPAARRRSTTPAARTRRATRPTASRRTSARRA